MLNRDLLLIRQTILKIIFQDKHNMQKVESQDKHYGMINQLFGP